MKRRVALKYLHKDKDIFKRLVTMSNYKVGDLVYGCSMLNEKVIEVFPEYRSVGNGKVLWDIRFVMESGCCCSFVYCGIDHPLTSSVCKANFNAFITMYKENPEKYWWAEKYETMNLNDNGTYFFK